MSGEPDPDTNGAEPEISPARQVTRMRILDAGLDLFQRTEPGRLLCPATGTDIVKAAEVTRATFYSYWETLDDYLADLVHHALSLEDLSVVEAMVEPFTDIPGRHERLVDALLAASMDEIETLCADERRAARLALTGRSDHPVVAELLRGWFEASDARQRPLFVRLLESWGREPRPPFDLDDLLVIYDAFAEGFASRRMFDRARATPDLYAHAGLAMFRSLTRQVGDELSLPDLLAEIDRYPLVAARAALEGATPVEAADGVGAARELLDRMPWSELTLVDLAEATGTPVEAVRREVGSKAALGARLYVDAALDNWPDTSAPPGSAASVEWAARALVDTAREHPTLIQSLHLVVAGMARSLSPPPTELLVERFTPLLDAGDVSADTRRLARLVVHTLLLHLRAEELDESADVALEAVRLLVNGAGR